MARRERRKLTDEFKAEVVTLVRSSGKSIGEISRDLDLTETAVREWVRRAEVDGGARDGLTTAAPGSGARGGADHPQEGRGRFRGSAQRPLRA